MRVHRWFLVLMWISWVICWVEAMYQQYRSPAQWQHCSYSDHSL